ncbi:MAG: hypothetical protein IJW16_01195 [Clostridia bacterium]|nr:hypothetical protein [Clostridia bacterium]
MVSVRIAQKATIGSGLARRHVAAVQDKAHQSRPPDGVVAYVEGVGEEQRRIGRFIG